jgi:hypothetical protein
MCKQSLQRGATSTLLVATILIASGCGDGLPQRVPVAGTVTIDGAPLSRGSIMFISQGGRPAGGGIDSQGHFTLSCYKPGDGATLGLHQVKVTAIEPINDRANRWHAPKKYADERSSGIEVEVTEPIEDLKIELTWDGGHPFVERW